jgi:hypothetical protein
MWLPTPIYERIPQFWLLLGLLFMSSGTYLGFDYSLSFVYFGVGFACCAWSIAIFSKRLRSRKEANEQAKAERAAAAEKERSESAKSESAKSESPQSEQLAAGAETAA